MITIEDEDKIVPGAVLQRDDNAPSLFTHGANYIIRRYNRNSESIYFEGFEDEFSFIRSRWTFVSSPNQPSTKKKEEKKMAKTEKRCALPYDVIVNNTKTGKILVNETVTSRTPPSRENILIGLAANGKIKSGNNIRVNIRPL